MDAIFGGLGRDLGAEMDIQSMYMLQTRILPGAILLGSPPSAGALCSNCPLRRAFAAPGTRSRDGSRGELSVRDSAYLVLLPYSSRDGPLGPRGLWTVPAVGYRWGD